MDLTDHEVQQRAEADRREVDPPIQVATAHVVDSWPGWMPMLSTDVTS
jgi:hypothetical protein